MTAGKPLNYIYTHSAVDNVYKKSVNTTFKKKRLHLHKNVQSHTLIINAALCVSVCVGFFSV